jgi:hypothetical protein
MRVLLRFMRSFGVRGTNCIDDNLWAAPPSEMPEVILMVRLLFGRCGWNFNEKCVWTASEVALYNGMWIDAKLWEIRATDEKIELTRKLAWTLWFTMRDGKEVSVLALQQLAGRLQSLKLALEGVAVWTRGIYATIKRGLQTGGGKYVRVMADEECMNDTAFWTHRLGKQNGLPICDRGVEVEVKMGVIKLSTDASDVGWGAVCEGGGVAKARVHGVLPYEASGDIVVGESSTMREITGVILAAKALLDRLTGQRVRIIMDSYPAIRNLIKGGGKVALLAQLVKEWWVMCKRYRITPLYTWKPREENTEADELSKIAAESYTLRDGVMERVRAWLTSKGYAGIGTGYQQTRVSAPKTQNIAVRIAEMQRSRTASCIIVPEWHGTTWAPTLYEHSAVRLRLGDVEEVCVDAAWEHGTMVAHVIVPK